MKKNRSRGGVWDFCCGIYLGCTIWLRGWIVIFFIRVICCFSGVTRKATQYFARGKIDPDARGNLYIF